MRAGSIVAGKYVGVPDGGILHAINYDTSSAAATIHGARVTVNLMGDGYVEAVSDGTIQALAGWMSPKMIERYSHVRAEARRQAISVLDEPEDPKGPPKNHHKETGRGGVQVLTN